MDRRTGVTASRTAREKGAAAGRFGVVMAWGRLGFWRLLIGL
jgi:hypothetical protein